MATNRRVCECPRCGYDLSALPPTWEDACPITGVCSECGLDVEWGEILGRHEPPPNWFAERPGTSHMASGLRGARTWWRVMRPGHFWSSIRLGHRPDPVMLAVFLLVAAATLYASAAAWVVFIGLGGLGRQAWRTSFMLMELAWPWQRATNPHFWIVPAASILAPTVFLVLGSTLSIARVRLVHVWRAGVYGVLGVATVMLILRLARIAVLLMNVGVQSVRVSLGYPIPNRPFGAPSDPWEFLVACGFRSSWAMLAAAVWLTLFWWFAISRYMRLEHPRRVTASVMVIALLAGLAVVQWWPGSTWDWWRQGAFQVFFW